MKNIQLESVDKCCAYVQFHLSGEVGERVLFQQRLKEFNSDTHAPAGGRKRRGGIVRGGGIHLHIRHRIGIFVAQTLRSSIIRRPNHGH